MTIGDVARIEPRSNRTQSQLNTVATAPVLYRLTITSAPYSVATALVRHAMNHICKSKQPLLANSSGPLQSLLSGGLYQRRWCLIPTSVLLANPLRAASGLANVIRFVRISLACACDHVSNRLRGKHCDDFSSLLSSLHVDDALPPAT